MRIRENVRRNGRWNVLGACETITREEKRADRPLYLIRQTKLEKKKLGDVIYGPSMLYAHRKTEKASVYV